MKWELTGGVAAVTGGASGIGRALARRLHQEGMSLALADVDAAGLEETASLLSSATGRVSTHLVDVADPKQVERFVAEVAQKHGRATLLVNNAGVSLTGAAQDTSIDDIEWLMRINFWGVVYGVKFFLPLLRREPHAHIANVSSIFGCIAPAGYSAYCASKFAVRGFTESLRRDLASASIGVSCVYPGKIRTGFERRGRVARSAASPAEDAARAQIEKDAGSTSSASYAADRIVDGIKRGEPRILVGRDAVWLDRFQRAFPVHYDSFLAPLRKARKLVSKSPWRRAAQTDVS